MGPFPGGIKMDYVSSELIIQNTSWPDSDFRNLMMMNCQSGRVKVAVYSNCRRPSRRRRITGRLVDSCDWQVLNHPSRHQLIIIIQDWPIDHQALLIDNAAQQQQPGYSQAGTKHLLL